MIGIMDCRIGNIGSLMNALSYVGAQSRVVSDVAEIEQNDAIILPGVGAFDTAMTSVAQTGFGPPIRRFADSGRPVLGICLGMQLLCKSSEEGTLAGLSLVDGDVLNLRGLGCTGKIPHVGFNAIDAVEGDSAVLSGTEGQDFYFVHSFALSVIRPGTPPLAVATVNYGGVKFVAAFQQGNIIATQFHPEKSGEAGLALLSRFLSCSRNG